MIDYDDPIGPKEERILNKLLDHYSDQFPYIKDAYTEFTKESLTTYRKFFLVLETLIDDLKEYKDYEWT